MKKKKGLKLSIVFLIIGIILVSFLMVYQISVNSIKKIIVRFPISDEVNSEIIELELKDNDFDEVKKMLRKAKKSKCKILEATANSISIRVNDKYTLILGDNECALKGTGSSVDQSVSIPNELYDFVNNIVERERKKLIKEPIDLANYEFKLDSKNKYEIITDLRWKTTQNDGGSYTSIYYQIDLDNNVVIKNEENYKAFEGSETSTVYIKYLDSKIAKEVSDLLKEILGKEDTNIDQNYNYFVIKYLQGEKEIFNTSTINNLNALLEKIDNPNLGERKLLFSVKSTMIKCPTPTLYVYDDNTYSYYDSNSHMKTMLTKEFEYDVSKILDGVEKYNVTEYPSYSVTDSEGNTYSLKEYKPLEDFLEAININIHVCSIQKKASLLAVKSHENLAWGYSFNGMAIFDDGSIYKWNLGSQNLESFPRKYDLKTAYGYTEFIMDNAELTSTTLSEDELSRLTNNISNIKDSDTEFETDCHGADMGATITTVYKNNKAYKISEKGDCDGQSDSLNAKNIISIIDKLKK